MIVCIIDVRFAGLGGNKVQDCSDVKRIPVSVCRTIAAHDVQSGCRHSAYSARDPA